MSAREVPLLPLAVMTKADNPCELSAFVITDSTEILRSRRVLEGEAA